VAGSDPAQRFGVAPKLVKRSRRRIRLASLDRVSVAVRWEGAGVAHLRQPNDLEQRGGASLELQLFDEPYGLLSSVTAATGDEAILDCGGHGRPSAHQG
jgi:hypothetical protein